MTSSEMQCTNVLIDYFFKEFVYKNLYVYDGKQKKELCDGLVEFQDAYVIFQIKEKNGSKAQDWLHKKVYRKAVSQIKDTIDMIKNSGEIEVESFSGEKIILVSTKQILPIIIFDSDDADYKQVYVSSQDNALRINVFSMNDFVKMLDSIAIPYDIVYYLELRRSFFDGEFPDVFINHVNDEMTTIAIGVVFNMIDDVDYTVEWMILASENEYDEYYEQILKEEKPWENGKKLRNY